MSEDTSLHEKVGVLTGLVQSQTESSKEFREEMRGYMERDLEAHEDMRKELHDLSSRQAVEKVKLGAIVAAATVIVNNIIGSFFKN